MSSTKPKLELLLARADDARPVLDGGLPLAALAALPMPRDGRKDTGTRGDHTADPDDLSKQRWGVVAPVGLAGDQRLRAIAPLIALRESQQGAAMRPPYRVPPGMDAKASLAWRRSTYHPRGVPEAEIPRYLLFLGDIDEISSELQQVMAADCFPGRLVFPELSGYAAYAEKVVRWESTTAVPGRGLLYAVRDGTGATSQGRAHLTKPGVGLLAGRVGDGREVLAIEGSRRPDPDELLVPVSVGAGDALLTVSHGLGAPSDGWASEGDKRARLGAMSFGKGASLSAAELGETPFLAGGLWFMLACFGAGCPAESAYEHWLSGISGRAASRIAALREQVAPGSGFVAALPQAVLANPDGPLAMIAHLDLAWSYSFMDVAENKARSDWIIRALEAWMKGRRSGLALSQLTQHFHQANQELTTSYDNEAERAHRRQSVQPDPRRPHHWMTRNDLKGYTLLGDPAARAPGRGEPQAARPSAIEVRAPDAQPSEASPITAEVSGDAVQAALVRRIEAAERLEIVEHFEEGSDGEPRLVRRVVTLTA